MAKISLNVEFDNITEARDFLFSLPNYKQGTGSGVGGPSTATTNVPASGAPAAQTTAAAAPAATAPSSAQAITPAATTAPSNAGLTATNGASPSDEAALRLQMTNAINEAQKRGGTIEGVKAVFTSVGGVNRGRDVPAALLPQVIAAINAINTK